MTIFKLVWITKAYEGLLHKLGIETSGKTIPIDFNREDIKQLEKNYEKYKDMPRDNFGIVETCLRQIKKELNEKP